MLRLNPVNSRDILAAGYDRDASELHIQQTDGTVLVFHRVPFETYQEFIEAKWKNRFVKKQLVGLFVQTERVIAAAH